MLMPRPDLHDGPSGQANSSHGLLLAALGVLTFSFTYPMTKVALRGLTPLFAATGRAAVASVLAVAVLVSTRSRWPTRSQWRGLCFVVAGIVIGFPMLTAFALRHTESAHGSVVNGLLPLATAGMAFVRVGERPSPKYWACSAIGFSAVIAYVVHTSGTSVHQADVLLVLAVVGAAVGYTEGAILTRELGGWQVICWALALAAPLMWMLAIIDAMHHPLHASTGQWLAFAYTACGSMFLGFFAWYGGLARAGIAKAGQLQLAQPALSIVWGWPLLGEQLTLAAIVTIAVVFTSVAIGRNAVVHRAPVTVSQ